LDAIPSSDIGRPLASAARRKRMFGNVKAVPRSHLNLWAFCSERPSRGLFGIAIEFH
jgi:hypothetical protein